MTENKAVELLEHIRETGNGEAPYVGCAQNIAIEMAITALEEIQAYRAIGTVEELKTAIKYVSLAKKNGTVGKAIDSCAEYESIGTVEEFKDLKEKNEPKKPIEKVLPYSEEFGLNSEWKCPTCGAYIGYFTEGMSEPEQMEYCNKCGQHIARDWSE